MFYILNATKIPHHYSQGSQKKKKKKKKNDLFLEMTGPQKGASVADTRDSLFSDSSSSEIRSDERRHSGDLEGW